MKKLKKELVIPSSQTHLPEADDFIESNLVEIGIDQSLTADIAISATEMINNAILHGNGGNSSKKVMIRLVVDDEKLEISILDQGSGFDLSSVPDPLAEENLMKEVGRGIFIARSLVDRIEFDTEPGWGTKATLTKFLAEETSK